MKFIETTEEKYAYGLEVLPPEMIAGPDFLVGEPVTHRRCAVSGNIAPTFEGYIIRDGKFWVTDEPVTRNEFNVARKDYNGHNQNQAGGA